MADGIVGFVYSNPFFWHRRQFSRTDLRCVLQRLLKIVYYLAYRIAPTHQHEKHHSGFTMMLVSKHRFHLFS